MQFWGQLVRRPCWWRQDIGRPQMETWPHFLLAVGLGALVGLLPDIDSPNTLIRQIFGLGSRQAWNNLKRWPRQNIFVNLC